MLPYNPAQLTPPTVDPHHSNDPCKQEGEPGSAKHPQQHVHTAHVHQGMPHPQTWKEGGGEGETAFRSV